MEVGRRKHLRDGQTSNCWSYGSINHPESQSRKMSIGVVVDSLPKKKYGSVKEREVLVPTVDIQKPNLGNAIPGKSNGEEVTAAKMTIESRNLEKVSFPWICTKTLHQETPTSDAALQAKQSSDLSSGSKRQYKLDEVRNTPPTQESGDNKQKKFNGSTCKKRGVTDETMEEVQDFTFAPVQEVIMQDKEVLVDKTNAEGNTRTETLRVKLWNILGTSASPDEQHTNSQANEVNDDYLNPQPEFGQMGDTLKPKQNSDKPEDKFDEKGYAFNKLRQNSDTIETDSESPGNTVKRPITRSLMRKRARTEVKKKTAKTGQSSGYNKKQQDQHIFSFDQECSEKLHESAGGRSSMSKRRKGDNKGYRVEPDEVRLPELDTSTKIHQAINRRGKRQPAKKACSLHAKPGCFQGSPPDNEREFLEVETNLQGKEVHQSPPKSKKLGRDLENPEIKDQQEDSENPSLKSAVNPEDNLSPTFGFKTPALSSSPSSIPKSDQMADFSSPARTTEQFNVGDSRSFRTFLTSKKDSTDSAETQSSDAAEEMNDSPLRKKSPDMQKVDIEDGRSLSSSEEMDLGVFEDGSPFTPGHKWIGEDNCIEEPSELNQVDGLARAVELFALGLEKLKTKIKTATKKKSSEILMSVAAEVHVQLQDVESQIQMDMGKLTNVNKSKRKKLETKFEEQQEQLKVICDKFKEQVNQHLQDCRSTFEGLEVYQTEFKGTVEKLKASHRKLILQVEEEIETQLNDAQRRIKATNESMRKQMLQLKHQLALCLNDGI